MREANLQPDTREGRNMAVLRKVYDAYNAANLEPLGEAMNEDMVMREHATPGLPWGGEWTGPDGMMNFVAKVVEHLNQKSFICEDMIAEGDTVIAWGYCETACAHTGREARIDWIHRVEMRDGRMVSVDNFYDSLNAAEALGRAKLL